MHGNSKDYIGRSLGRPTQTLHVENVGTDNEPLYFRIGKDIGTHNIYLSLEDAEDLIAFITPNVEAKRTAKDRVILTEIASLEDKIAELKRKL